MSSIVPKIEKFYPMLTFYAAVFFSKFITNFKADFCSNGGQRSVGIMFGHPRG
jgi:hypothetical protein